MLDAVVKINHKHHAEIGDPEIQTTIAQQELAFRMQTSVPELADLSKESKQTLELYGPEVEKNGSFALQYSTFEYSCIGFIDGYILF